MAQYPDSAVLVETEWLAANASDRSMRLVEVDEDTAAYEVAHIPGAIAWHWQKDLHHALRRDFIDSARLQELLARSGVGAETTVTLYGGNNNWFAAYAYWYLKYQGFDNVKLLNGGRKKWERENRPMTADRPTVTPAATPPKLAGSRPNLRALSDEVLIAYCRIGERSSHTWLALMIDRRS